MLLEFFGGLAMVLITFALVCLYFGSCWLVSLFVKDISKNDVSRLNLNASDQKNNKMEMIGRFRNLISNLSEAKQLSAYCIIFDVF